MTCIFENGNERDMEMIRANSRTQPVASLGVSKLPFDISLSYRIDLGYEVILVSQY